MKKPNSNAFVQLFSSERVIGALLLVVVLGLAMLFPTAFTEHQQELITILAALVAQFVGLHTYVKVSAGELLILEDAERPLLGALKKLWGSRKFVVTVIGLLLELLVVYLHMPEEIKMQLMGIILGVVTFYNGAVAVEDAQSNRLFRQPETAKRAI